MRQGSLMRDNIIRQTCISIRAKDGTGRGRRSEFRVEDKRQPPSNGRLNYRINYRDGYAIDER